MTVPPSNAKVFGRILRACFTFGGLLVAAILDHVVSETLATQEKAGHDIGWLNKFIAATPQFWVVAVAFVILLLWCLEPRLREKRSATSAAETFQDAALSATKPDPQDALEQVKAELNKALRARAELEVELVAAQSEAVAIRQQLSTEPDVASHDRAAHIETIRKLEASADGASRWAERTSPFSRLRDVTVFGNSI